MKVTNCKKKQGQLFLIVAKMLISQMIKTKFNKRANGPIKSLGCSLVQGISTKQISGLS